MPTGWAELTLSELTPPDAPIIYGILQPGPHDPKGIQYVRPTEIFENRIVLDELRRTSTEIAVKYSRSQLTGGDTILSIVGTIGKVAAVPAELHGANITQSSCRIRVDSEFYDPQFLRYFLKSPIAKRMFDEARLGTAVPRLNIADIRKFPAALPPLAEQRRIVAKLDALTARLTRARREVETAASHLSAQRLKLLRFGVMGRLTAGFRDREQLTPILETLRVATQPMQGRGGRDATDKLIQGQAAMAVNDPGTSLPSGWAWVPLLRVAKQETGHTPSRLRPDYWDGGVPWIGIRDAGSFHGRRITETAQTISAAGLENSSARLLPAGTVALSRTASVGYCTILDRPMATSQDFATWTCTEALVPEYLLFALMAEGDDIKAFGMGSTHTTIYFPEIRAFHIALPPVAEQVEIVTRLTRALARVDRLEAEAARARALIDRLEAAILARAFRGELVPQDPNDEPASVLLDRIRARRAAEPAPKRKRRAAAPEAR